MREVVYSKGAFADLVRHASHARLIKERIVSFAETGTGDIKKLAGSGLVASA